MLYVTLCIEFFLQALMRLINVSMVYMGSIQLRAAARILCVKSGMGVFEISKRFWFLKTLTFLK